MRFFGHTKPVRDPNTGDIQHMKESPVKVRTVGALGGAHGIDQHKRLVMSALRGDLISLRPERTRREVCIPAIDLYTYLLRLEANKHALERAREKKAAKEMARRERRLRR